MDSRSREVKVVLLGDTGERWYLLDKCRSLPLIKQRRLSCLASCTTAVVTTTPWHRQRLGYLAALKL